MYVLVGIKQKSRALPYSVQNYRLWDCRPCANCHDQSKSIDLEVHVYTLHYNVPYSIEISYQKWATFLYNVAFEPLSIYTLQYG